MFKRFFKGKSKKATESIKKNSAPDKCFDSRRVAYKKNGRNAFVNWSSPENLIESHDRDQWH